MALALCLAKSRRQRQHVASVLRRQHVAKIPSLNASLSVAKRVAVAIPSPNPLPTRRQHVAVANTSPSPSPKTGAAPSTVAKAVANPVAVASPVANPVANGVAVAKPSAKPSANGVAVANARKSRRQTRRHSVAKSSANPVASAKPSAKPSANPVDVAKPGAIRVAKCLSSSPYDFPAPLSLPTSTAGGGGMAPSPFFLVLKRCGA